MALLMLIRRQERDGAPVADCNRATALTLRRFESLDEPEFVPQIDSMSIYEGLCLRSGFLIVGCRNGDLGRYMTVRVQ